MASEWSFNKCKGRGVNESLKSAGAVAEPGVGRALRDARGRRPVRPARHRSTTATCCTATRGRSLTSRLQGMEDTTPAIRTKYGKPTIWDEVRYEGSITSSWGALSAAEEADRLVGRRPRRPRRPLGDGAPRSRQGATMRSRCGGPRAAPSSASRRRNRLLQAVASTGADGALAARRTSYGQAGDPVSDTLTGDSVQLVKFRRQGTWNVPLPRRRRRRVEGGQRRLLEHDDDRAAAADVGRDRRRRREHAAVHAALHQVGGSRRVSALSSA